MVKKGILLAGGTGSRLAPLTYGMSKHLLPIHDKPLIYYPLSVLMLAGIRDILIICREKDRACYSELLGDGRLLGLQITYAIQDSPRGIVEAFLIGERWLNGSPVILILGDNIFWGSGLSLHLASLLKASEKAFLTLYPVGDPDRFGLAELGDDGAVLSIEEKPSKPRSKLAVTGLYAFPPDVVDMAKKITFSNRNELEIVDLQNLYLSEERLYSRTLGRGFFWIDAGTVTAVNAASEFVQAVENHQKVKIGCLEEIAMNMGFISPEDLYSYVIKAPRSPYFDYVRSLL